MTGPTAAGLTSLGMDLSGPSADVKTDKSAQTGQKRENELVYLTENL